MLTPCILHLFVPSGSSPGAAGHPALLDTHLVDADLLELLLGCGQRGRGRAGGHVLLVTAQGHVLLQTGAQGECHGWSSLQGWMYPQP